MSRLVKPGIHELYDRHQGKVSTRWESYLEVYERAFGGLRDRPIAILEVGVQNGGSLEIWAQYFPQAETIVGCDIDLNCAKLAYSDTRIRVVVGNILARQTYDTIRSASNSFDIIIDDGSHLPGDIIGTFLNYFPLLRPGGVYLVEDLHCSYWPKWGGGIVKQNSAYAFFKLFIDLVNHEHWESQLSLENLFSTFVDAHVLPPFLKEGIVDSIEVHNSMAVLRRSRVATKHKLGKELIVGNDASVLPRVLDARKARGG